MNWKELVKKSIELQKAIATAMLPEDKDALAEEAEITLNRAYIESGDDLAVTDYWVDLRREVLA